VDVVVVSYNTRDHLAACLAAVSAEAPTRVVVVDNASTDGSPQMVRERYPNAILQANTRNLGFGQGANQGIADCTAEYVLLLNSDTRLAPGALSALTSYLDSHPRVAIAGPRLVGSDGHLQASCFPFWLPFPLGAFAADGAAGRVLARLPRVKRGLIPADWYTPAGPAPWVVGAAIAVRRAAFEAVGGFDAAFFMYFEDVDLCRRLVAAGWDVHFAPVTTISHVGGASTRARRTDMAAQYFASTMVFHRRYYPAYLVEVLRRVVWMIALSRCVADRVRLGRARDSQIRARLERNVAIWQGVLRGLSSPGA
jgi:N-acetylglucosaminyl-diphospho-decaprenol L-rhamnosyltransferase